MDENNFSALLDAKFDDPIEVEVREDLIGCPYGSEFLILTELRRISAALKANANSRA